MITTQPRRQLVFHLRGIFPFQLHVTVHTKEKQHVSLCGKETFGFRCLIPLIESVSSACAIVTNYRWPQFHPR